MTDHKPTPSGQPDADELFDRPPISASDADFLSELDRVLADTANPLATSPGANQAPPEEPAPSLEPLSATTPAQAPGDLWERLAAQQTPPSTPLDLADAEPASSRAEDAGPWETRREADWGKPDEVTWEPPPTDPWDAAPAPAEERMAQTRREADWDRPDEVAWEPPPTDPWDAAPAPAEERMAPTRREADWDRPDEVTWEPPPTPAKTPEPVELAWEEPLEPDRVVISKAAAERSARALDTPPPRAPEPAPAGKLDWSLPDTPPGVVDWEETPAVADRATAPEPAAVPSVTEPVSPPPPPAPRWPLGLALLLGAAGIGVGGASLWSLNAVETRLAQLTPGTSSPVGGPDPGRLESLEQRLDETLGRVGADLLAFNQSLEERLKQGDPRQAEALAGMRDQLSGIQTQLDQVGAQFDAIAPYLPRRARAALRAAQQDGAPANATQAQTPAPTAPDAAQPGPQVAAAPLPTTPPAAPVPAPARDKAPEPKPVAEPPAPIKPETLAKAEAKPAPKAEPSAPAAKPAAPAKAPEPATKPAAETTATATPAASPKPAQKVAVEPGPLPKPSRATPPDGQGWVVNLSSFPTQKGAEAERERLAQRDIEAEVREVSKDDQTWYRVTVTGFADAKEAKAYAGQIRRMRGFSDAWVGRD